MGLLASFSKFLPAERHVLSIMIFHFLLIVVIGGGKVGEDVRNLCLLQELFGLLVILAGGFVPR